MNENSNEPRGGYHFDRTFAHQGEKGWLQPQADGEASRQRAEVIALLQRGYSFVGSVFDPRQGFSMEYVVNLPPPVALGLVELLLLLVRNSIRDYGVNPEPARRERKAVMDQVMDDLIVRMRAEEVRATTRAADIQIGQP